MTFSSNQSQNTNQLPVSLDVDPKEENFSQILLLYLRRVASAVNTKASGLFLLQETGNFEQWFTSDPGKNRSAYRITVDVIALYGGVIPALTTVSVVLTTSTQPVAPIGFLYPVQGFGGATDTAGNCYFPSDPTVQIQFKPSTNTITITNNTVNDLTQLYWVMEYLKN